MSKLENMFFELLEDAEAHNPDSRAVIMFREILETMSLNVTSAMRDVNCNEDLTVFENLENPEAILKAIDLIDECKIDEALDEGLSYFINIRYSVESSLSLNFTTNRLFKITSCIEHEILIKHDNIIDVYTFEDELNELLKSEVLTESIISSKLNKNIGTYDDDVIYTLELEGKEFIVKDLVNQMISRNILALDPDQLP
jgi:hypothetical protein